MLAAAAACVATAANIVYIYCSPASVAFVETYRRDATNI